LYVGGVSRRWRGRHLQYCAQNSTCERNKKLVTRQGSVLMSASRLQLAISSGLEVSRWTFKRWSQAEVLCKHSLEPQQVMALLRLHGVPWATELCEVAAHYCKLSLLQWLRASSCPWQNEHVLMQASRGGSVAVLEWLQTVVAPWSAAVKSQMLNTAGWSDKLEAAKWLRAQGADWPEAFASSHVHHGITIQQCWSLSAVQWAIASGSGWRRWRCGDYAKEYAATVLVWAHANGCPCTCEHQQ
jgi:hypothetical protein